MTTFNIPAGPGVDAIVFGADGETPRLGFFTDTSVCIGCKACEVACKEWNDVPPTQMAFSGKSLDNTLDLGADAWRHVAFVEQLTGTGKPQLLMESDVCKHCTQAGCLDVCPTGAIFRTEFETVVVQADICNGCGYCVTACPFGVIERREGDGRAFKCTLCYDRSQNGQEPACAQACPTDSIQFGPLDLLRERAGERRDQVVAAGESGARLYGADPDDGVGGFGAFFLLLDEPERYGLPPKPVVPTRNLREMWSAAAAAFGVLVAAVVAVVGLGGGRR
jgi:formate dehydrogenase iron-sulfur subunit